MNLDRWRELEPLLDQALELPAAERAAWLEALRARSPELAAELSSLLEHEEAADRGGFLAQPVELSLAGLELGAYTLERPLGQGGMGTVWLARRTDGRFEGLAAVKLLNLALLGATGRERFRREGSALARLSHPGIARLLDAGVGPGGQPYLVLEHVDGQHIDDFVEQRALPTEARLRLFLQVLAAVGHAHANLVVHRDLKPSNILVTADGAVKLLDFGIAKLIGAETGLGPSTKVTIEGGQAMTPEFAAPEQVRGDPVTTATDVYALGVLLYVLLSGRHPTAEGCRTAGETIRALFEVDPARLKLGDLDTVLAKALRKAQHERYQTVGAFADDVERYLRHEPVRARPDSLAYRARKAVRRNRAAVAATAVAAAALVGATVFSVGQMREARRQRDAALYAKKRADAQVEFQALLMSEAGDRPVTMREILDKGRVLLERHYAGDPRFLASTLVQLATSYTELGDTKMQRTLLVRAESIAVALGDARLLPAIRCGLADNLRLEGRAADARRMLDSADAMIRAAPDPESEVECLARRGYLANEEGSSDEAITVTRRALAIKDSLGETRDAAYLSLLGTHAEALDHDGRPRDAVAMYLRTMAAMDSTGRGGMMSGNIMLHDMAMAQVKLGETAEAQRALHEVIVRAARADPSGRIHVQPLVHYAQTAYVQGDADSAVKYFDLLARQAVEDGNGYWESRATFGLAQAQLLRGDLAAARLTTARYRRVSATAKNIAHTDDHILDARVLDGRLALAAGDSAAAHRLFVEALRARGYFDGKRLRQLGPALLLAARTAIALGRPDSALAFARDVRTRATVDSLAESRSAFVGEAWLMEARALLAAGDSSGARDAAGRALVAVRAGGGEGHPRVREAAALVAAISPK